MYLIASPAARRLRKAVDVIRKLFERAVSGFIANASLRAPHLMVMCHTLLSQALQADSAPTSKGKHAAGSELLLWMSVSLLHSAVKKRLVVTSSPRHVSMLDPFLPLMLTTLQRSKSDRVLVVILRVLVVLVPLPLPSMSKCAKDIARTVMALIHTSTRVRASAGRSELSDCALKTFTALLRHCKFVKVCVPPPPLVSPPPPPCLPSTVSPRSCTLFR